MVREGNTISLGVQYRWTIRIQRCLETADLTNSAVICEINKALVIPSMGRVEMSHEQRPREETTQEGRVPFSRPVFKVW